MIILEENLVQLLFIAITWSIKMKKVNSRGFTLIEVLIALLVLSIGILAVSVMQITAIKSNSTSFYRAVANNIGNSIIEELKRLPFDDPNLSPGADLNAGKASFPDDPSPDSADHKLVSGLLPGLSNTLTIEGTKVKDDNNKTYTVFWNILNHSIGSSTPYCIIKLFIYWDSPLGQNHLEFTAVKDNNFVN